MLSDSTGQLISSDDIILDLPILFNSTAANKCGIYTFETSSNANTAIAAGISLVDCAEEKPFLCEKPTSSVQEVAYSFVSFILLLFVQKF